MGEDADVCVDSGPVGSGDFVGFCGAEVEVLSAGQGEMRGYCR